VDWCLAIPSFPDLIAKTYLAATNANPKPLGWMATAESILERSSAEESRSIDQPILSPALLGSLS
jgi:hypothetical protein